jgi:predicted acylesterase/phospholipase RssA
MYPIEDQRRNILCEQLLDMISDSVLTFKPSKSLGSLSAVRESSEPAVEIDIVVSGGGLKGYFMAGCSHILLKELAKQNVKIARVAGASAGAWCGMFILTGIGTETWVETYYKCKERPGMTMHEAYTELWPWMESNLPKNAWEICNNRLFVSVTEVTMWGVKNHMISTYTCNEDLFEACMASSTVPYISLPGMLRWYKNMWCVDGGVTNNTPVFPDNVRRQLVFRLGDVLYPLKFWINPNGKLHCVSRSLSRTVLHFTGSYCVASRQLNCNLV